jgi:ribosomal biogenesis protein LAS1
MLRSTAAQERRKRGSRIKFGLGELGPLDASPPHADGQVAPTGLDAADPSLSRSAVGKRRVEASSAGVFGSWQQWLHVKSLLFSLSAPSADSLARARSIVNLWKLRSRPTLRTRESGPAGVCVPPYVEATLILLEAAAAGSVLPSAASGQLCWAILRVVHALTEDLVTAKSFRDEVTTYRLRGRAVGMPEEAVEVRQRIAHGASVPGDEELRWVAGLLLAFLRSQFWDPQEVHVEKLVASEVVAAQDADRRDAKRSRKENTNVSQAEILSVLAELEADDEASPPVGTLTAASWQVV